MSLISGTIGAVMGSSATESAAQTSAQATETAAQTAANEQYAAFSGEEALNEPYLQASYPAIANLQSAILGGPASYQAPGYTYNIKTGMYDGPNGVSVKQPPQLTTTYQPKATPEYQYEQDALKSSLLAMGRGNSSYSGYLSGQLAAQDYQTQISNLSGLAGIGQGSTSALTSAAAGLGSNLSSLATGVEQANSLAALMSGQAQSSLYSGMGAASGNAAGLVLNAYNSGMFSGSGSGGGSVSGAGDTVFE